MPARAASWSGLQEPATTLLPDGRVLVSANGHVHLDDPGTGDMTSAPRLRQAWTGYSATLLADGTVLMAGGWDEGRGTSPVETYDPSAE